MKRFRVMAGGLCAAVLFCGFSVPAYAYADGGGGAGEGGATPAGGGPPPGPPPRPAFSRAERAQPPRSMAAIFSSVRDW